MHDHHIEFVISVVSFFDRDHAGVVASIIPGPHFGHGPVNCNSKAVAGCTHSACCRAHCLWRTQVRALHPAHTASTIRDLIPRFKYYDNGTCIVHHIFGGEVCEVVREAYGDAYLTAHFEVSVCGRTCLSGGGHRSLLYFSACLLVMVATTAGVMHGVVGLHPNSHVSRVLPWIGDC